MSKVRRLWLVLLLNLLLVAALVIVGLAAHSLGVLAAGVDYLADAAAIGVSLLAIRLSHRAVLESRTRYQNPTEIAALINAGWLLALNIGVVVAATRRLVYHRAAEGRAAEPGCAAAPSASSGISPSHCLSTRIGENGATFGLPDVGRHRHDGHTRDRAPG